MYSFLVMLVMIFSIPSIGFAVGDIDEIRELLQQSYYKPVSDAILENTTITEIEHELDPYTMFFSKQEYDEFMKAIDMNYIGIGIIGEQHEMGVKVVHLLEKGAAIQSELQVEDIIIEVDGTSLDGKTVEESQPYILGKPGTTAYLKVFRPSTNETLSININRVKTEIASTVESGLLGGNIGYIRLNSFNEDAVSEIQEAMKGLGDVAGWIVDIRGNSGGYLEIAQEVAGLFPNVETALMIEGQDNGKRKFPAIRQNPSFSEPVFLLINSESASASEILAGAVKDQKGAILYGQTTFGKGLAQAIFQLSSGNYFKMTVAQFYTPNGKVINERGIDPDVKTEVGEELEKAHYDMLLLGKGVKRLNGDKFVGRVPRNVEITINLENPISVRELESRSSFVELGGQEIEFEIRPLSFNTFKIVPTKLLNANASYLLKINSGTKDYILELKTSDKIEKKLEKTTIFSDVEKDDFFVNAATVLSNEGLLKGIGESQFGPYYYVTREQAAVFFARILGLDTEKVLNPLFTDVQKGDYFYTSVAAVKEAGIMQGKTQERFGTSDVLTREEMAALLVRAFELQVEDGEMPFEDVGASPFATDILKIYQSGLASGSTETTFSPNKAVTRGEFVTFLYRALIKQNSNTSLVVDSIN